MSTKSKGQAAAILSTGKKLTQKELDEIRELVHRLDDAEDIKAVVNSGILNSELPFGCVPESCMAEIAARKSVLERQEDHPWQEAATLALREWCAAERDWLRDLFNSPRAEPSPEEI